MKNILNEFHVLDDLDNKIVENQQKKVFFVNDPEGIKQNNEELKYYTLQELDSTTRIKQWLLEIEEKGERDFIQQQFKNKVAHIGRRWKLMIVNNENEDKNEYLSLTQREIELKFLCEEQNDFKNLEADIRELFLVFKQIQMLVDETAPKLNKISEYVEQSVDQTNMAVEEMNKAIQYDKKFRRKKCIILCVVIAVVIIIIIAVATPLAIQVAASAIDGINTNKTI